MRYNNSYKCVLCGHVFEGMDYNPNIILEHYSVHKKDDPEISIPLLEYTVDDLKADLHIENECSLCGQCFNRRILWEKHMKNHHNIPKPYKCDKCDFATHLHQILVQHQVTHTEKQFKCDQCDYTAHSQYCIKRHIAVNHGGVRSFKCDVCDFASKNLLIG